MTSGDHFFASDLWMDGDTLPSTWSITLFLNVGYRLVVWCMYGDRDPERGVSSYQIWVLLYVKQCYIICNLLKCNKFLYHYFVFILSCAFVFVLYLNKFKAHFCLQFLILAVAHSQHWAWSMNRDVILNVILNFERECASNFTALDFLDLDILYCWSAVKVAGLGRVAFGVYVTFSWSIYAIRPFLRVVLLPLRVVWFNQLGFPADNEGEPKRHWYFMGP